MNTNKNRDELPFLIIIAALFVCGCAIGIYLSRHLSGNGMAMANDMASKLLYSNDLTFLERLYNSFVTTVKLPILVFALSLSAFGKYTIPFVFSAKGFLIAFYIGCMTVFYESGNNFAILALELIPCLFTLPCMVLLSKKALFNGQRHNKYSGSSLCYAGCLLLLIPAIVSDMLFGPILLNMILA